MPEEQPANRPPAPPCRWRTSSETLDVIEALERIEALLLRLDERLQQADSREQRETRAAAGPG